MFSFSFERKTWISFSFERKKRTPPSSLRFHLKEMKSATKRISRRFTRIIIRQIKTKKTKKQQPELLSIKKHQPQKNDSV